MPFFTQIALKSGRSAIGPTSVTNKGRLNEPTPINMIAQLIGGQGCLRSSAFSDRFAQETSHAAQNPGISGDSLRPLRRQLLCSKIFSKRRKLRVFIREGLWSSEDFPIFETQRLSGAISTRATPCVTAKSSHYVPSRG